MPGKGRKHSHIFTVAVYVSFVPSGYRLGMTDVAADVGLRGGEARRVGRPRKWASEAERKRAYRERLAADLEDPLTLRRDLRTERRRTAGLNQDKDRLRARLAAAERRTEEAEESARVAEERMALLKEDAERNRRQLFEARAALVELQAELRELRVVAARAATSSPDLVADETHRAERSQASRLASTVTVRHCYASGCPLPATCRVRGPRGVERDACEAHARPGRRPDRWRVVRKF
jgi:hypothetical protein